MTRFAAPARSTTSETLTRWAYSLLLMLLIPVVELVLAIKGKRVSSKEGAGLIAKLGWIARPAKEQGLLFHCVSVGEVTVAAAVIEALRNDFPDYAITISTTTRTGADKVQALFGDEVHHIYLPYDLPWSMNLLLRRVNPRLIVITEVELWPNLVNQSYKRRIPVTVINARMTTRSASRYKQFAKLFLPMCRKLSLVMAQGQRDFDNYRALGIADECLVLTNNIKFDQVGSAAIQSVQPLLNGVNGRPIIVGGSTHAPEESALLSFSSMISKQGPSPLMVIVPRHPQRFDDVEKLIKASGLAYIRTSQTRQVSDTCSVVLVDEMGQLNRVYSQATIAFVGGSLAEKGGHNALEPAAFSKPVIMGPHQFNNPEIGSRLSEAGALITVNSAAELRQQLQSWLDDSDSARQAGENGRQVVIENTGALQKTLGGLSRWLYEK